MLEPNVPGTHENVPQTVITSKASHTCIFLSVHHRSESTEEQVTPRGKIRRPCPANNKKGTNFHKQSSGTERGGHGRWPGHFRDRIWPNRIWPALVFSVFWPSVCVCSRFWVCSRLCVCGVYGVFKIFGGCLQDFWWVSSRFLGLSAGPPPPRERPLPGTAPPLDRPKFRSFFLSPAGNFILSSLSGGSSRLILVVFLKAGTLKCARLGSRAVV